MLGQDQRQLESYFIGRVAIAPSSMLGQDQRQPESYFIGRVAIAPRSEIEPIVNRQLSTANYLSSPVSQCMIFSAS
jgi:hypothetical protein